MERVSVIIPTLNAERELKGLLSALEKQTVSPAEILVVDSSSSDGTAALAAAYPRVRVFTIPRESFNHGGTRQMAAGEAEGDFLLFMTQDAVPASESLIQDLLASLREDETVAAAYARQLPREDASARERLVRQFNYPDEREVRSAEDIPRLGIKAFFLSDVCAVYRRASFRDLGGFETEVLSNEDMLFAAKALRRGYRIAYAADARVIHSHNLSLREQYERNRIQGYEIARHRDLLGEASASREGIRMLKTVAGQLLRQGRVLSVFALGADCAARYLGSRAGERRFRKDRADQMKAD